jgi:hypothetical protein
MGKSNDELKARRFAHRTVRESDCICQSCMIIQRLQLQIVRSHADVKLLMQRFDSVANVVLSI